MGLYIIIPPPCSLPIFVQVKLISIKEICESDCVVGRWIQSNFVINGYYYVDFQEKINKTIYSNRVNYSQNRRQSNKCTCNTGID